MNPRTGYRQLSPGGAGAIPPPELGGRFARALELWNAEGREAEKPYFGWLSTELALYPESTTNLKTNAHTRPVGERPYIDLEPAHAWCCSP